MGPKYKLWTLKHKKKSEILTSFSPKSFDLILGASEHRAQEVLSDVEGPSTAAPTGAGCLWKECQHASWKSSLGHHLFLTITAAEWRGQLPCWASTCVFTSLLRAFPHSGVFGSLSCGGDELCVGQVAPPRTSSTHYYSASDMSTSSAVRKLLYAGPRAEEEPRTQNVKRASRRRLQILYIWGCVQLSYLMIIIYSLLLV